MGEWAGQHGSVATEHKAYIGKVTNYFTKLKVVEIKIESGHLQPGDRISIQGPTTGVIDVTVQEIRVDLKPVTKAIKGDHCSISVDLFLRRADKIYKVISNK
jgi:putative protease